MPPGPPRKRAPLARLTIDVNHIFRNTTDDSVCFPDHYGSEYNHSRQNLVCFPTNSSGTHKTIAHDDTCCSSKILLSVLSRNSKQLSDNRCITRTDLAKNIAFISKKRLNLPQ